MTERPSTEAGERLLASSVGWVAPHPDDDGTFIPVVQDAMCESILAIETEAFMDGARASRQNRKEIEAAAGPPASAERVTRESLAAALQPLHPQHELIGGGLCRSHWRNRLTRTVRCKVAEALDVLAALPSEAAVQEPAGATAEQWRAAIEAQRHAPLTFRAAKPPPASVEAEGLDVELAEFFHGEYWDNTNEPHYPRDQAKSGDCAICWGSADRLLRLLEQREA